MDREPLTITAAAPLIRDGQLTPSDLLEQCLARIDRYEEKVRAWVYLDRERARTEAAQLTSKIKKGHYRGPLHGIPVGVKDIIDVFDMPTGCGSKLWANSYARRDATCVQRLREAGALILGKTVTTAYAYLDPPPTRNPWNLERTPGGSSSGSAAAVACGMCLAALGTQTGGSITRPASYCGVCSLKPTYGRVSVDGVLPLAPSLDHVGAMANCVRDLAVVFQTIAGTDRRDPASADEPVPDFTWSFPEPPDPQRVARVGGLFAEHADPFTTCFVRETATRMAGFRGHASTDAGGVFCDELVIEDIALPASFREVIPRHAIVMATEAADYHGDRIRRHPDDYPSRITHLVETGLGNPAAIYADAKRQQADLGVALDRFMIRYAALLTPAATGPAPPPDTTGNPIMNSPWSYTGLPTISVPFGWSDDGLPLAVQFVGKRWGEADLFAVAAWWQQLIGFEPRPVPV